MVGCTLSAHRAKKSTNGFLHVPTFCPLTQLVLLSGRNLPSDGVGGSKVLSVQPQTIRQRGPTRLSEPLQQLFGPVSGLDDDIWVGHAGEVLVELLVRVLLAKDLQDIVPAERLGETKDALALYVGQDGCGHVQETGILDVDGVLWFMRQLMEFFFVISQTLHGSTYVA